MSLWTGLRSDFNNGILIHGQPIRIRHFVNGPENGDFDDALTLVRSGNDVWTTGLILPIRTVQGSDEAVLMAQGKIQTGDKRIYIAGDVETSVTMKIGIGSPSVGEYSIIPDGVISYPPVGDIVYKKMFVRELKLGSLVGE